MDFYKNFGSILKDQRLAHSESQEEAAAFLSVTQQQYAKYESGKDRIPLDVAFKLYQRWKFNFENALIVSNE